MFDEICSELRDMIYNAIHDMVEESDFDELAPKLFSAMEESTGKSRFHGYDCDITFTDDGLAIVCGEDTYSISIQKG